MADSLSTFNICCTVVRETGEKIKHGEHVLPRGPTSLKQRLLGKAIRTLDFFFLIYNLNPRLKKSQSNYVE